MLVVTCEQCGVDYEGLEDFKKKFFGGAQWMFDYQQLKNYPRSDLEIGPLSVVDYLINKSMNNETKRVFEMGIYNHFFDLAKKILTKKETLLQKEVIKTLEKMLIVIRNVNATKERYYSKRFEDSLSILIRALRENNLGYFANIEKKDGP